MKALAPTPGMILEDLRRIRQTDVTRYQVSGSAKSGRVAGVLLAASWLMFFLWPTAGAFAGTHGLKYATITLVLGLGYLAAGTISIRTLPMAWLGWALVTGVISGLSYIVFMHELWFGDGTYIARPFFFVFALLLAHVVGSSIGSQVAVTRMLRPIVIVMLLLQTIVALTQTLNLGILDAIYSADKVSPFGGAMRITGTLGNPNLFAYHVLLAITFLASHSRRTSSVFLWLAFGLLLVILSGSRTVLLLYAPSAIAVVSLRSRDNILALFRLSIPILFVIALSIYLVFMLYAEYFPYIGQLISLFAAGEILGFRAFALRLEHWSNVWAEISYGNLGQWLFGRFDGMRYRGAIDNDWLFMLWRQGLLGLLSTFVWYLLIFLSTREVDCETTRKILRLWMVIIVFFSIMFESVAGWWIPFVIMIVVGMYSGSHESYARKTRL